MRTERHRRYLCNIACEIYAPIEVVGKSAKLPEWHRFWVYWVRPDVPIPSGMAIPGDMHIGHLPPPLCDAPIPTMETRRVDAFGEWDLSQEDPCGQELHLVTKLNGQAMIARRQASHPMCLKRVSNLTRHIICHQVFLYYHNGLPMGWGALEVYMCIE